MQIYPADAGSDVSTDTGGDMGSDTGTGTAEMQEVYKVRYVQGNAEDNH